MGSNETKWRTGTEAGLGVRLTKVNGLDAARQRSELDPDAGASDEPHAGGELHRERHGVWISGFK